MSEVIVAVHGFVFVRTGECAQCGACGCEKLNCPHFGYRQGLPYCKIYNRRGQFCNACGMTHQGCVDFPNNPWINVVRDGVCAFTFERQDGGSMDDLPFLNGQNWYRGG